MVKLKLLKCTRRYTQSGCKGTNISRIDQVFLRFFDVSGSFGHFFGRFEAFTISANHCFSAQYGEDIPLQRDDAIEISVVSMVAGNTQSLEHLDEGGL